MKKSHWNIAHASAIGLAHLNQETECQDRFGCKVICTKDESVLVAVVADGAGSTSDGQRGAEIACEFFIKQIEDFMQLPDARVSSLNAEFGYLWIPFFHEKVEELARLDGKQIRDFASTMIAAVIGENEAACFQIGDGGLVISTNGEPGSYHFALEPEESEYLNTTNFLTDENSAGNLRFTLLNERIEDVILFSDGIFPVAVDYQSGQPHEPFLVPMMAPLRNSQNGKNDLNNKLEKYLATPKLNEKTDDDKTIILASRANNHLR